MQCNSNIYVYSFQVCGDENSNQYLPKIRDNLSEDKVKPVIVPGPEKSQSFFAALVIDFFLV